MRENFNAISERIYPQVVPPCKSRHVQPQGCNALYYKKIPYVPGWPPYFYTVTSYYQNRSTLCHNKNKATFHACTFYMDPATNATSLS